jgi:hypothetical protein
MNSRSITGILITAVTIILALAIGVQIVTAQFETILFTVAGGSLLVCFALGPRIWMLIPLLGTLNLTLMIPGQPSTLIVAQAMVVGFCLLRFLMRRLDYKVAFTELGFWSFLLSLCILQAYIRNPISLDILGGEAIGGRAYALFLVALIPSVILSTLKIPAPDLRWILRLSILGGLTNFFMLMIGNFVPNVGIWYGSVSPEAANGGSIQQDGYRGQQATKVRFVRDISQNIALWIGSYISPLRACFHPVLAPLIILSLAFAALSGFRVQVGAVGLTYLVAIAYRGGRISVALSVLALIAGLLLLALVNLATPLPANVQRSLSFLPGSWDPALVKTAEDSTAWRVEMWEEALLTDFWIKNKILGDGLGMTREEFNYMQSFKKEEIGGAVGSGKLTKNQEFMMASGAYHSGPVSTIRAIGYAGLLILLLAQFRLAVHAHRQIQRAKNTEWLPLTLLVGIPLVWAPFYFVFVFGDFGPALTTFLMGAAMVRILENNLPLPIYVHKRPRFHTPLAHREKQKTSQGLAMAQR